MAGQVAPKVARFEMKFQNSDTQMENVFHARATAASWDATTLDAVEAAFVSWFSSTAYQYVNDQVNLYEMIATDLTSLSGLRRVYPISPPLDGNISSAPQPANATFAVKANIGTRGRGQNGRVFWISLSDDQTNQDQLNKTNADEIVTALNTLRTSIAAVTGCDGLCIPHFVVGGVRPPSVGNSLVTSFSYSDLYIDSQRDRLPFHKKHKKKVVPTP